MTNPLRCDDLRLALPRRVDPLADYRKGHNTRYHSLTDGIGTPLANHITPAKGDERAPVVPLLDAVQVRTGRRGRPRKRLTVIATDKGYDTKALRQQLRKWCPVVRSRP